MKQARHRTLALASLTAVFLIAAQNSTLGANPYKLTILPIPAGFESTDSRDGFQGVQVGRGAGTATDGNFHALLWNTENASVVELHPEDHLYSFATSVYLGKQVGWVGDGGATNRATLWQSTAESAVDLHPAGFLESNAYGVSEEYQVGWAFRREPHGDHAMIWSGTADSAVDLHPEGYIQSRAYEVSGSYQVGYVISGNGQHAALWQGSAESFIDLNPTGFKDSFARSVEGIYQVGSGTPSNASREKHALLWQGTPTSVVDFHPPGLMFSHVEDVYDDVQVGFGRATSDSNLDHALLWRSTASSVVDLHQYVTALDSRFQGSRAFDIEPNGDVIGHVIDANGGTYAARWSVIPEPCSLALVSFVLFVVALARLPRPFSISGQRKRDRATGQLNGTGLISGVRFN